MSTAVDSGLAPAWELVKSIDGSDENPFNDYSLVVAEYFTLELSASSTAGAPYAVPTGVAKVPDYIDSSAPAAIIYKGGEEDFPDQRPAMHNCAFADIVMNKELFGGYNDVDVPHSCQQQMDLVNNYKGLLDQYDVKLEEFETMQQEYNTARTAENARKEGFFSNAFDPVIAVPHRPMAPWTPADYAGIPAVYEAPVGGAADMTAYFPAAATRDNSKTEWIAHMQITAGNGATFMNNATGHIFGITGQGDMAMPGDDARAFTYHITGDDTGIGATDQAVMMVSIFPTRAAIEGGVENRNITL